MEVLLLNRFDNIVAKGEIDEQDEQLLQCNNVFRSRLLQKRQTTYTYICGKGFKHLLMIN